MKMRAGGGMKLIREKDEKKWKDQDDTRGAVGNARVA